MLEGKLVRLRAREPADAERGYTWLNDPEVTRWISDRYPLSMADEERWARDVPANSFAHVRLSIETKDGVHIGNLSLHSGTPEDRKAELGIVIGDQSYWSKGYGTDAVRTILRFAFREMNLHRVWLATLEYNERAIACYRKCGFVEEGRLRQEVYRDGRYHDFVCMGILRDEFDALHEDSAHEGGR